MVCSRLWIGHDDLVDNGFKNREPDAAYRCALVLFASLDGPPSFGAKSA